MVPASVTLTSFPDTVPAPGPKTRLDRLLAINRPAPCCRGGSRRAPRRLETPRRGAPRRATTGCRSPAEAANSCRCAESRSLLRASPSTSRLLGGRGRERSLAGSSSRLEGCQNSVPVLNPSFDILHANPRALQSPRRSEHKRTCAPTPPSGTRARAKPHTYYPPRNVAAMNSTGTEQTSVPARGHTRGSQPRSRINARTECLRAPRAGSDLIASCARQRALPSSPTRRAARSAVAD